MLICVEFFFFPGPEPGAGVGHLNRSRSRLDRLHNTEHNNNKNNSYRGLLHQCGVSSLFRMDSSRNLHKTSFLFQADLNAGYQISGYFLYILQIICGEKYIITLLTYSCFIRFSLKESFWPLFIFGWISGLFDKRISNLLYHVSGQPDIRGILSHLGTMSSSSNFFFIFSTYV